MAIFLFVHSHVFFAARTAFTIVLVDFDLFLFVLGTVFASWKGSREGRVASFVTFPSDALFGLSFYLDLGGLFDSVVPVRRWKDTDGDRDFGVKVQFDGGGGACSRMPSEPFLHESKGRQEETLASVGERR